MSIAESLGMTYTDLVERLPMSEFKMWIAYYEQKLEAQNGEAKKDFTQMDGNDILREFGL